MDSRLLTHREQSPFFTTRKMEYGDVTITEVEWDIDGLCKAQRDLTASIKDAEKNAEFGNWRAYDMAIAAQYTKEQVNVTTIIKDAECEARIEASIKSFGDIISWGEYGELADGTKIRDGHIMSEPFERLVNDVRNT